MKLVEVFERIGLVEISDEPKPAKNPEFTEIQSEEAGLGISVGEQAVGLESEIEAETPMVVDLLVEIAENRSFDEIYSSAGIAESPFSADKLLRLLEALGNLPEETRKQAVIAMDAAEDNWTIEDPLLDARRRIQALENEKQRLGKQADSAKAQATQELEAQNQYEQQAIAQIRKQITELEALMEREMRSIAESRERIKAQSKAARESCEREQDRLAQEITRLQQIEKMFSLEPKVPNPQNETPSGARNG